MEFLAHRKPLKIPQNGYAAVAVESGVSEKLVRRVVRSISVGGRRADPLGGNRGEGDRPCQIGLRLIGGEPVEVDSALAIDTTVTLLARTIREYNSCCPSVVQWVARGEFDPRRPPKELKSSHLLHATRTAGRLRAALLRQLVRRS